MDQPADIALDVTIEPVPLERIIDLRWRVLRAGLPRQTAMFTGDESAAALHVAALRGSSVVGCATLHQSQWEGAAAWQLRGMAVEAELRGSGVGRRLLQGIDALLIQRQQTLRLWCNAREVAVGFYLRMGWKVVSERFVIETAGPHFKMSRLPQAPTPGSGSC
jgi:predicted GNAT family N-acyltransferase